MAPSALTLVQTAELYGISSSALLHYEEEGIVSPLRVGTERYYSTSQRLRIEVILKGKLLGFSLGEIKSLILAHLPEPRKMKRAIEIQQRIGQLEIEKLEIQSAIERLSKEIEKKGEDD